MRNLLRDTAIYGASAILSRGLALIVLPIYTHILAPADYGALDMITVAGTLVALVVGFEMTQAVARLYGELDSHAKRRTMASTALFFVVAMYGVVLGIALAAVSPLSRLLLGTGLETPFRIGAVFIAATGVFYLLQNQLRVELRAKHYAIVSLTYAVATVSLGLLLAYAMGLGLNGVLLAQLMATMIAILLGLWYLRDSLAARFDSNMLREMLHFSLPLVPSGVATFLTLYANRLLLNGEMSLEAVGFFGVAARIAGIVTLLTIGLQASLTPLILAHYKEADTPSRIAEFFEKFAVIAMGAALALGLFAPELLAILTEARYAPAAPLVMALAPATLLSQLYIFFPGIAIMRRTHLQLVIFAVTGIVSLCTNWLLVMVLGTAGAAIATLLASLVFLVMWIVVSQRLYPIPVHWRRVGLLTLVFFGLASAGFAITLSGAPLALSLALRLVLLIQLPLAALVIGVVRMSDLRGINRDMFRRLP